MYHFRPDGSVSGNNHWPSLPFYEWKNTYTTLHLFTQIVGKIRLVQSFWVNQSWNCTLYVTSRGLTTSTIPYGARVFQIDFDLINHQLCIQCSDGAMEVVHLRMQSVASFYEEIFSKLEHLNIDVKINTLPNELESSLPFEKDYDHATYDASHANRFFHVLVQADRVLKQFRARFTGKCSPVHFFWGSFDLAVTRFSGRPAPVHPGGIPHLPDWVTQEAYSQEVSSCGFWPGNEQIPQPVFYSYAYPEPVGFATADVLPESAEYNSVLREFILPYETIRQSEYPDKVLLSFFQSSYESAANLNDWNRSNLEQKPPFSQL